MPHSSGGGSSSGGSHGGSSSSSGGHGGGRSSRISHRDFPGAYRYMGYNDGRREYIYSDNPSLNKHRIHIFVLLFYIPFIIAGAFLSANAIHIPSTMKTSYTPTVLVMDEEDMISDSDEKSVEKGAEAVYKATGVPVCVRFESNDAWGGTYTSLEDYAYDTYLNMYNDEDHWLIIYTDNSKALADTNARLDWYFEGMQGDNTDKYLPGQITSKFNTNLYNALSMHNGNIGQSFEESFESLAKDSKRVFINKSSAPFALFWDIFVIFHMFFMVFHNPNRKYKNYVLCDNDEEYENENKSDWDSEEESATDSNGMFALTRCPHCGHVYRKGSVMACPKCGRMPDVNYDDR